MKGQKESRRDFIDGLMAVGRFHERLFLCLLDFLLSLANIGSNVMAEQRVVCTVIGGALAMMIQLFVIYSRNRGLRGTQWFLPSMRATDRASCFSDCA